MSDIYINPRDVSDPPRDDMGDRIDFKMSPAQRHAMREVYAGNYIVSIDVTGRAHVVVGRSLP